MDYFHIPFDYYFSDEAIYIHLTKVLIKSVKELANNYATQTAC